MFSTILPSFDCFLPSFFSNLWLLLNFVSMNFSCYICVHIHRKMYSYTENTLKLWVTIVVVVVFWWPGWEKTLNKQAFPDIVCHSNNLIGRLMTELNDELFSVDWHKFHNTCLFRDYSDLSDCYILVNHQKNIYTFLTLWNNYLQSITRKETWKIFIVNCFMNCFTKLFSWSWRLLWKV